MKDGNKAMDVGLRPRLPFQRQQGAFHESTVPSRPSGGCLHWRAFRLAGPPPSATHAAHAATADQVAACDYVAHVKGVDEEEMYPRPGSGRERARIFALDKAEEVGATHLVWGPSRTRSHGVTEISGVAYRCGRLLP
jgi:hypothetical protein